jgi:hypothetical protein
MRYGVDRSIEAQTDAILRRSLSGVTQHAAKKDILTPWKAQDRASREVFVSSGIPDPAIRRGSFGRAFNPQQRWLNSREGVAAPQRLPWAHDLDNLAAHVERYAIKRDPFEEFDSFD